MFNIQELQEEVIAGAKLMDADGRSVIAAIRTDEGMVMANRCASTAGAIEMCATVFVRTVQSLIREDKVGEVCILALSDAISEMDKSDNEAVVTPDGWDDATPSS